MKYKIRKAHGGIFFEVDTDLRMPAHLLGEGKEGFVHAALPANLIQDTQWRLTRAQVEKLVQDLKAIEWE